MDRSMLFVLDRKLKPDPQGRFGQMEKESCLRTENSVIAYLFPCSNVLGLRYGGYNVILVGLHVLYYWAHLIPFFRPQG